MALGFKLLGRLQIEDEAGKISEVVKSNKGSALLAYLLVAKEPQPREHLADLLWDAASTAQSLQSLRTMLTRLRKWVPELEVTRTQVRYPLETAVFCDYHQLLVGLDSDDPNQLAAALLLYRGDLLESFYLDDAPRFNDWLLLTREKLHQRVFGAFRHLCELYQAEKAWGAGIALAQQWLALDELDEEALRYLLQLLAASGQIDIALQQFETSRQRLWDELGVEPMVETQQLAAKISELKAQHGGGIAWEQVVGLPLQLPAPDELPPPDDLPRLAYLPYQRNPSFVGRRNELLQIGQTLLPREASKVRQRAAVVTGMGGLGKTQVAVEFCYRYGRFFPGGVFWLSFAEPENIATEVVKLGGERGMVLFQDAEQLSLTEKIERVQKAWQEPIPRLLIFDNCENENDLAQWLPTTGGCRLLITSRRGYWSPELHLIDCPLPVLAAKESTKLLIDLVPTLHEQDAQNIATELGHLPLALHLAGSFLRRYPRITPSRYLAQLEQLGSLQHPSLQGRGSSHSPTAHERNLASTFALSLEQLDPTDEIDALARQLLARAACFAPGEPIPSSLLLATLREAEESDLLAELLAEDGLARLLSLGFLRQAEAETVVIHRLLVRFTQQYLTITEAKTAVCQTVATQFSQGLQKTQTIYKLPLALGHVSHLIQTAEGENGRLIAQLAYFLGTYFHSHVDFDRSQRYFEQALFLNRQAVGHDDIQTAKCLNGLGILHARAGVYRQAGERYEEALEIYEKLYGADHVLLITLLNNVGYLHTLRGSYQEARVYFERMLAILKRENELETARAALCWNNLGMVLLHLDDDETAQAYLEKGLRLRERELGADHPYTAVSWHNVGLLYLKRQAYELAQTYLETGLTIRQQAFGQQHPHTTRSLNGLGELFLAQADYERARAYFEQALAIQAEVLSPQHPEKAAPLKNMGELYWARGQREQARPFFEQAREILRETAVSSHPDLVAVQAKLRTLSPN